MDENAVHTSQPEQWPPISFEELSWQRPGAEMAVIQTRQNRKTNSYYLAALPLLIADRGIVIPESLAVRISALLVEMARFDVELAQREFDVSALLLRSESVASIEIERLISGARSRAIANVHSVQHGDLYFVSDVETAIRDACEKAKRFSVEEILKTHVVLTTHDPGKPPSAANRQSSAAGKLRQEQVWVGGTSFSPLHALFVPPTFQHLPHLLEDLVEFGNRKDLNPVVKAAVLNAQFETIQPFSQGNGTVARVLLQQVFFQDGVQSHSVIPVSVGILRNMGAYLDALQFYRKGNPLAVITVITEALEEALFIAQQMVALIEAVMEDWEDSMSERQGSAIKMLPALLVMQPIVNTAFVANNLGISQRAALSLINRACEYGILSPMGQKERGDYYQCNAILEILDQVNSLPIIRQAS